MSVGREPNPSLAELAVLGGEWVIELSDAEFLPSPDTRVQGRVTAEWIDNAALVMRQFGDEGESATWIMGRDESESEYTVLYSDARGFSRVYRMTFAEREWQMWRSTPKFTQRFQSQVSSDGDTITGEWQKSYDSGETWVHDFAIEYRRES
ncbi:hypothetical protein [Nocardia sp. NPDC006630]|uniref:hypothetical protein n=1 Tax=Nocardia sp. NPDC006630 TaxID=3157181 RepID=UPI0033BEBFC9